MSRTDRFDPLAAPAAAEAATELGLDLDGDGSRYYPAPPGTLARPMLAAAAVMAAVAGVLWGPELAALATTTLGPGR